MYDDLIIYLFYIPKHQNLLGLLVNSYFLEKQVYFVIDIFCGFAKQFRMNSLKCYGM